MKALAAVTVTMILVGMIACGRRRPVTADLSAPKAAELISEAPEFNHFAKLVTVENTTREPDSLADCCYRGVLTFQYINAPVVGPPVKAFAEFRYWDRAWHFTDFDYGCPTECHIVGIANPPMKAKTPY